MAEHEDLTAVSLDDPLAFSKAFKTIPIHIPNAIHSDMKECAAFVGQNLANYTLIAIHEKNQRVKKEVTAAEKKP